MEQVTLWKIKAHNEVGYPTFEPPIIIKARWQGENQLIINKLTKQQDISVACVYAWESPQAPEAKGVKVGSYLFQGVSDVLDPVSLADALQIKKLHTSTGEASLTLHKMLG